MRIRIFLLLLSILSVAGCDAGRYSLWLLQPREETKVQAESTKLEHHSVAVIVACDPSILCDYPTVQRDLQQRISAELQANVEGCRPISTDRVERYKLENLHWDSKSPMTLGTELEVDYVLYVFLAEYTTRESGQSNVLQGRVYAEPKLYAITKPEDEALVWDSPDPLEVVYPEYPKYQPRLEGHIRNETDRQFADMLAKRFYDHTIEQEETP